MKKIICGLGAALGSLGLIPYLLTMFKDVNDNALALMIALLGFAAICGIIGALEETGFADWLVNFLFRKGGDDE